MIAVRRFEAAIAYTYNKAQQERDLSYTEAVLDALMKMTLGPKFSFIHIQFDYFLFMSAAI